MTNKYSPQLLNIEYTVTKCLYSNYIRHDEMVINNNVKQNSIVLAIAITIHVC